jgi:putative selenium metabolism hydrolase
VIDIFSMIRERADSYAGYTAGNLSELVKIRSLSTGEKEVAQALVRQMNEAGFDEARIDGLGNVIGRIGNGKKVIVFDGHIDTVDTGNPANWSKDPFSGDISGGFVHGRGTVDQKGGVASFVTAGKIIREIGLPEDVTALFTGTVMEEDCDGLCWKYLVEEEKIRPDLVVVTEPTNLNIYRGQRGRMEIEVEFRGVSSHGSAPERGKNAIYMASHACREVEKLNERLKSDDFLGKGSVTVTEFVSGSPSLCAVADYARIHLDRRLTWGETKESALAEISAIVQGTDARVILLNYDEMAYTGLRYGMEKYYPTWKMEQEDPWVVRAEKVFSDLFGKAPVTDKWTFSTNGVVINGIYGIPVIGFGPGNEVFAHAPDEKVPVSDLVAASAFYAALIINASNAGNANNADNESLEA